MMFGPEVGPDTPYECNNRLTAPGSLLGWVWSQPPEIGAKLAKKTFRLRTADAETRAELQRGHRLTWREIQRPDLLSPDVLVALKKLIATHRARNARGPAETGKRDTPSHPSRRWTNSAAATRSLPAPHGYPKRNLT